MPDLITLEIITASETAVKEDITELYIPAFYGEAGILFNHLPYISVLGFGEVSYKDAAGKHHYLYIENGFMEARNNCIVIISDLVVRGEDLDRGQIESGLSEINSKIQSASKGAITPEELDSAILEQKKLTAKSGIVRKTSGKG
jgi:F-type H+-transporting ATPase subunit epsilon